MFLFARLGNMAYLTLLKSLYSNDDEELADNIVRLLNDDQMNAKLSDNAVGFTRRFKSEKIIPVWNQMFHEIQEGVPAKYIKPENNEYRPKSYDLKMALHNARMKFGMRFVPSFISTELCRLGLTDVWMRDIVKHYFLKAQSLWLWP